jgi:hypothetical protein
MNRTAAHESFVENDPVSLPGESQVSSRLRQDAGPLVGTGHAIRASECEVRRERPRLSRKSERGEFPVEVADQISQIVGALGDADPQDSRRMGVGKCATSREDNAKRSSSCGGGRKSGRDLGLTPVQRSPQKAERQMEIVYADPTRLPRATLGDRAAGHFLHQLTDGGADLSRRGHGDE